MMPIKKATVGSLSFLLNKLIKEYGETLDQEFMFFMYASKLHLMLNMDLELKEMMTRVTDFAFDNKVDVSIVLKRVMQDGLSRMDELVADLR